jgi:hypothetical protein
VIHSVRVLFEDRKIVPIPPPKEHPGIDCLCSILLGKKQFNLLPFFWNEQVIVEEAGAQHEIKVAHIHIIIVDGSTRILDHVLVLRMLASWDG